jgi:ATP-binding protein involved in chromosome partitioning
MKSKLVGKIVSHDVKLVEIGSKLDEIENVVLVGSGKGGVGKSFVACGLSLKLAQAGYRTGLFDIDIHGASLLNYLGAKPPLRSTKDGLEPKKVAAGGLKVMSVALLTGNNSVPLRGSEKQSLITQFFSLTNWGKLDFLIVDLPPSTGDELLTAFEMFGAKASLIMVTTPSRTAINIVSRLSRLAKSESIRVLGIVLNMAYSKQSNREISYPFGRVGHNYLERTLGSRVITEIPLDPRVSTKSLEDLVLKRSDISKSFQEITQALNPSGLKRRSSSQY